MKTIYISLPIDGSDTARLRQRADLIKGALSRQGYRPICILDNFSGKNPTYADRVADAVRMLLTSDGVFFPTGWEGHMQCQFEHDLALRSKSFIGRDPNARDFKILYEQ